MLPLIFTLLIFSSSTLYVQSQSADYEPLPLQPLNDTIFWSDIDLLISNNTNFGFKACSEMASKIKSTGKLHYVEQKDYQICVQGVKVRLYNGGKTYGVNHYTHATYGSGGSWGSDMYFHIGQEGVINQIFDKFLEWESIAITNNSLPFNKEIPIYYPELIDDKNLHRLNTNTFVWTGEACRLEMNHGGFYDTNDVIEFKNQLNQLPKIKVDLANKIRKRMNEIKPDSRTPADLNLYK